MCEQLVPEEDTYCIFLYVLRNLHVCSLYETKLPVLSDFMEVRAQHNRVSG